MSAPTWRGEQGWGLVCTVIRVGSVRCGPERGCYFSVWADFAQYFGLEVCKVGPNADGGGVKCAKWASTRMRRGREVCDVGPNVEG